MSGVLYLGDRVTVDEGHGPGHDWEGIVQRFYTDDVGGLGVARVDSRGRVLAQVYCQWNQVRRADV